MTDEEFIVILVTTATAAEAAQIARTLVEERLIACGNVIGPIRSLFRWQGAVDDASEHLLLAKARAADFVRVEERVRTLHSYDVPEVIAVPIRMGSAPYLGWLADATARGA
ncbi:MAG: divalent-cation tolerance protein CutA [Deltaproteobacteria bacterium]|nr:MAG: divalent-cation tolerance protein CutA [Deltaproteobacteria bacterium]